MKQSNIEHLYYLDDILIFLKNKQYTKARIGETKSYVFQKEAERFNKDNKEGVEDTTLAYKEVKFQEAISYLIELGLIYTTFIGSSPLITYVLTFKGHIKAAFGFVDQHEKDSTESKLRSQHMKDTRAVALIQKITLPAAIIVALLAIFWKSECSTDTMPKKCDCEQNENDTMPNVDNKRLPKSNILQKNDK